MPCHLGGWALHPMQACLHLQPPPRHVSSSSEAGAALLRATTKGISSGARGYTKEFTTEALRGDVATVDTTALLWATSKGTIPWACGA